eukprot:sb/3471974/
MNKFIYRTTAIEYLTDILLSQNRSPNRQLTARNREGSCLARLCFGRPAPFTNVKGGGDPVLCGDVTGITPPLPPPPPTLPAPPGLLNNVVGTWYVFPPVGSGEGHTSSCGVGNIIREAEGGSGCTAVVGELDCYNIKLLCSNPPETQSSQANIKLIPRKKTPRVDKNTHLLRFQ